MWGKLVDAYNWTRRTIGNANNIVKRVNGWGKTALNWTENLLKTPAVGELAAELAAEFPEVAAGAAAAYVGAKAATAVVDEGTSYVDSALNKFPEAR
jgi:hypothetical protein